MGHGGSLVRQESAEDSSSGASRLAAMLRHHVSAEVGSALMASFLIDVAEGSQRRLLQSAVVLNVAPGNLFLDGDPGAWSGIVVLGRVRVFGQTGDGSMVACRNVEIGRAVGIAGLIGEDDETWAEALTASELVRFDLQVVHDASASDPTLSLALAREVYRCLRDSTSELLCRVGRRLDQRVARELLDLGDWAASRDVTISHEALANSIGSRREVVTRVLDRFAKGGLLVLGRRRIQLLDVAGLQHAAR
jgi:CRP-like cAMP-binding protein